MANKVKGVIKKQSIAEAKPFLMMDKEDEEQIVREMRGEIIKEYVYSFTQKGKVVEGLSKAGVDAIALEMAQRNRPFRIIGEPIINEDDKYVKAIVKVGRYLIYPDGREVLMDTVLGTKRQAKFYSDGTENPFAYEQALIKAERNAKRRLIPEKIMIEMLKLYKEQGRVKRIKEEPSKSDIETEYSIGEREGVTVGEQLEADKKKKKLIQIIHILKKDLEDAGIWKKDTYGKFLQKQFQKHSSKDMNVEELEKAIELMNKILKSYKK